MPFKLNNRLDILDYQNKWYEATVIEMDGPKIKVSFKGFTQQYDEVINTQTEAHKIKEVGSFSSGHGWASTP